VLGKRANTGATARFPNWTGNKELSVVDTALRRRPVERFRSDILSHAPAESGGYIRAFLKSNASRKTKR
jgi:hypothetical protein